MQGRLDRVRHLRKRLTYMDFTTPDIRDAYNKFAYFRTVILQFQSHGFRSNVTMTNC